MEFNYQIVKQIAQNIVSKYGVDKFVTDKDLNINEYSNLELAVFRLVGEYIINFNSVVKDCFIQIPDFNTVVKYVNEYVKK